MTRNCQQIHAKAAPISTAILNATGQQHDWLPLRRWCRENLINPVDVPDKRYGSVKSWPRAAWRDVHGVDLPALFLIDGGAA